MNQLKLIELAEKRTINSLKNLPSAINTEQDTALYKLILIISYEAELFLNAIDLVREARNITKVVSEEPLGYYTYIDLFTSPLHIKRKNRDYYLERNGLITIPKFDGSRDDVYSDGFGLIQLESDSSYYTGLFVERHRRISDGSMMDVANYVYAATQLVNSNVGVRILEDESVSRYYLEDEFTIEEGFNHNIVRQVFWIEFHKPNVVPLHIKQFYYGMNQIKPAGVCFLGAIFYCDSAVVKNYVYSEAVYKICGVDIIESGAVCCLARNYYVRAWDDDWGEFKWDGEILTDECFNTELSYIFESAGDNVESSFLDSDYTYLYYGRMNTHVNASTLYYLSLKESEPLKVGAILIEERGYNYGGYDEQEYSYYEKLPLEVSKLCVIVHAGRNYPRLNPFTEKDFKYLLDADPEVWRNLPPKDRLNKIEYSQKCFVSTSGYFKYIPWNSKPWGKFPWNVDFREKLRDNESCIYITLHLYCPTNFVTTEWAAPHIACPRPTGPFYQTDLLLFTEKDYLIDEEPQIACVVTCECNLFDNFNIPC